MWSQKKHIVYPLPPPHFLLLLDHIRKAFLSLLCCFIRVSNCVSLGWSDHFVTDIFLQLNVTKIYCFIFWYLLCLWQHFSLCRNVRHEAEASVFSTVLLLHLLVSIRNQMTNILIFSSFCFSSLTYHLHSPHLAVLDVYVLSTDGQVQDFKFPQSNEGGISIQLSANTVKLNSRNGKLY